jgi:thioredoxin-like negative regulator of GroEL
MAPVVHGLETQYEGRIDFLYLNVAEARNDSAERALGFRSTPHFFFLRADGSTADTAQGVIPADSLRMRLDRLLTAPTPP